MEFAMDLITFSLGLIVGLAIMLLRSRLGSSSQQVQQALNSCQQENAQLKQNWQDHLAEYRSLATNLNEMSRHIEHQIQDAELLLESDKKAPAFPFFSQEATHILKNANRKKREHVSLEDQPLDYSGSASGLFQGENAQKTKPLADKH